MRTQGVRAAVLSAALGLFAAAVVGGEAPSVNALAEWAPAESIVFVAYDGANPACRQTALHQILAEPEIRAVFEKPLAELKKVLADEAMKKGELDTDVLMGLLRTRVGLAFLGLAPPAAEMMDPQPELLLVVRVGKKDSAAARAVRLLVEHVKTKTGLAPDAFKPGKVMGVDAFTAMLGEATVTYATAREHFVLGTGNAVSKALDANVTKLAAAKEFQRVSRVTGGREVLVAYYAHAAAMQKFGMFMPPEAARVLLDREFGLANVRSLSFAFSPDGRGFRCSALVHAPGERKGLLKLLAAKPLNPAVVKLAPKQSEFFCAQALDLGALWDFVVDRAVTTPDDRRRLDEGLAEAKQELGFDIRNDLVASLGGEFALFGPPLTFVVKLRDRAAFERCVNAALKRIADEMGKGPDLAGCRLELRTLDYRGHTLTYLDGRRFPLIIQPCYTMVGDYAVVAPTPMALKTYLETMAAGANLTDKTDFQAVRAKIGGPVSSLYYGDSKAFLANVYRVLPFLLGLAKAVPAAYQGLCPDPARLPPPSVVSRHLFGSVAGCRAVPDGLLWESHSPVGLPTPPSIRQGAGVATSAILAGMLLPALGRARGEARKVRSAANLSQIGKGVHLWLLKHGENKFYPPSLKALADDGIIQEPKVFLNPAGDTRPVPGKFVCDYDSVLDRVDRKLAEGEIPPGLPLAWEKANLHGDGRNVMFFDAHVQFVTPARFDALMKEVDAFVKKMNQPAPPK
jgi:prepilin-type processing-associated H-X9-DG protein